MWESNDLEIVLVEEGPRTRFLTFSHMRYERMIILLLGGPQGKQGPLGGAGVQGEGSRWKMEHVDHGVGVLERRRG